MLYSIVKAEKDRDPPKVVALAKKILPNWHLQFTLLQFITIHVILVYYANKLSRSLLPYKPCADLCWRS